MFNVAYHQDQRFIENQIGHFPDSWKSRLTESHKTKHGIDRREANIHLRAITAKLDFVRLPLDASDGDICKRAEQLAVDCMDVGRIHHQVETIRAGMAAFVVSFGLNPPSEEIEDKPAIMRMTCRDWWRKGLRKMHAKAVEGAAIELGYVNRALDLYVSNESVARRGQQVRRNQRMMETTVMENDDGDRFTLAELAAKGTANKAIRRGELMTRIAGFEVLAVDSGHGGLFLTVTCPSRMHKWVSAGGDKVFENLKYDGTTPKEAQAYLSACYARIRAKLARDKVGIYGFRIAEPHHDGCPHWHILLFHPAGAEQQITDIFRHYMLADSPDEKGADVHRVKAEIIDWSRGTAAGYIAKYVAKNIDGLHVENDLYGNPAMETSMRVEAWASTWGIRQFQQVGGAPVGVWRELRRIKDMPDSAPQHLKAAHVAVNKIEVAEGETKSADWAGYVKAQGGVFSGRKALIKISYAESDELGRYGELVAHYPVGVETVGGEFYRDGIVPDRFRLVEWVVNSARHSWHVVKGEGLKAGEFSRPWTCVNNCTREIGENGGNDIGAFGNDRGADKESAGLPEKFRSGAAFDDGSWFVGGDFG